MDAAKEGKYRRSASIRARPLRKLEQPLYRCSPSKACEEPLAPLVSSGAGSGPAGKVLGGAQAFGLVGYSLLIYSRTLKRKRAKE